jgi:hypothetical protein
MNHYLYKITNKVNGKYYIGIHSTDTDDDDYLGSGVGVKRARQKYGDSVFVKEVLAYATTRTELLEMERRAVTQQVVADKASYNMVVGGNSAVDFFKQQGHETFIEHQKMAGQMGGKRAYRKMNETERKEWHSKGGRAMHAKLKEQGLPHPSKGQKRSAETKSLMTQRCKEKPKYQCPHCTRSFDAGNLKIHVTFKHPDKD